MDYPIVLNAQQLADVHISNVNKVMFNFSMVAF
jgi:hypothetical protein